MQLYSPIPIAFLTATAIMLLFVALWRRYGTRDVIESRLGEYGQMAAPELAPRTRGSTSFKDSLARSIRKLTWAEGLAESLRQADMPYTAVEYVLIMLGLGLAGFVLGTARAGVIAGLGLGALGLYGPVAYLSSRGKKRRQMVSDQLPDVLTLLVGALRAGYGLSQALKVVADQAPPPSREEFSRAMQAVELGQPIQQAMTDMAERLGSDDVDLFVTTINIQVELGGSLATTLDTIGETIRDRIRLQREIRTQTSQQQMSGYVLVALPFALGLAITLISPGFISPLFGTDLGRIMLVGAVVLMIIGYLIMKKILDLDV